jgi:leucyl/phenylalanyl-tRNA--protein transferase
MAIEPEASHFRFETASIQPGEELVGVGADLEPGTLLSAYRAGLFPMPVGRRGRIGWWSPDPRGILPLDNIRVSRSLRASCRRFRTTLDTRFEDVVVRCADPRRPGGWIRPDFVTAYSRLHNLGWAHSVEVWAGQRLVGGMYGVAIGGLFAGESMFHLERDASKVALVEMVELLREADAGQRLFDVQWATPHLASLGVIEVPRPLYLQRLALALALAPPPAWA